MLVRDVMSAPVVSVPPETPLKEVARLFIERRISGVPVVDADGAVLGVVSEADFLVKERAQHQEQAHHGLLGFLAADDDAVAAQAKVDAATAGAAMSSPAITVCSDCSLREAAALMVDAQVNRLPVVDDGTLVGIVTRSDLVRAYLRSDEELARVIARRGRARHDVDRAGVARDRLSSRESSSCLGPWIGARRRPSSRASSPAWTGSCRSTDHLAWELDDRHLEPGSAKGTPESGAASLAAREHPRTPG